MIPYSYNMVDMGGIDLAEANGTVVPGVYEKIVEAMNLCGDVILYNWKFAEINLVPSAYTILQQVDSILINGIIQVTELDEITVLGIEPPPPPIVPVSPLDVTTNGIYEAEPPASGFNPVQVSVPQRVPIIESISIAENGIYSAPEGVDGFSPVSVNVSGAGNISYGAGDPVASTGSNGDVYFKYEHITAGSSLLPEGDDDLDNWEKNAAAFTQFDNTCVNGENMLIQKGGNGYERIFVSVSVDPNTDYVFAMKYCSPSGVASGYGGQICFGVSFASESSIRNSGPVTLDYASNLSRTAESDYSDYSVSFNSGNHTSAYLVIDLNITDNMQCTLKFKDIAFYKAGEPPVYVDIDIIRSAYLKQNGAWVDAIGAILD